MPRLRCIAALLVVLAGTRLGAQPPVQPGSGSAGRVVVPITNTTWPLRTREHVDLWLHCYALLTPDTTLIPYFRRGYRERIAPLRKQTTLLDDSRTKLLERIAIEPSLAVSGQFLPLYFASWEQMRQVITQFVRAGGNPRATPDATTQTLFAILGSSFQSPADREWLRQFSDAADDESRKFYHAYWTAEARTHAAIVTHVDSLWQLQWRPSLQRFLNNTQQQNGELYLSLPVGGEGRTVHYNKSDNGLAAPMPETLAESEIVVDVVAHEVAGAIASTAITDNTSPADQRAGRTAGLEQAAAVRAGALLIERTIPAALPGYMRFYLLQGGRAAPNDPRTAFVGAFILPDAILSAITRQLDVILGGI